MSLEPGRDGSPEVKMNFIKYEFPLSSYIEVGTFTSTGLAEGTVPQGIGKVVEMRIRVFGHNSESWIILSEVTTTLGTIPLNFLTTNQIEIFCHPRNKIWNNDSKGSPLLREIKRCLLIKYTMSRQVYNFLGGTHIESKW